MFKEKSQKYSYDYNTPRYLFNYLNTFFKIELDPCATSDNYLDTKYYFTKEQNGLTKEWRWDAFVNPPYGLESELLWINKAIEEHKKNMINIFLLLPNKTEAPWFSTMFCEASLIIFPQQRIHFVKRGRNMNSNTMGSVIFGLLMDPQDKLTIEASKNYPYLKQPVKKFMFPSRDDLIEKYS